MTRIPHRFQWMALACMLLIAVMAAQVRAEDAKPEAAWQSVITGQIEAFRAGDGETALGFAGAGFRSRYDDPDRFIIDIALSGYQGIVTSKSHSFGTFEKLDEELVMQVVRLNGPNDKHYEAIYQLGLEEGGWKVQAVAIKESEGLSI